MSSTDYNYDTEGQFFPYFILTITGVIIIPLTYATLKPSKELENTAPRIRTEYKPVEQDLVDDQKKKQKRRELKLKRLIFSGLGWLLMGYMVYLMVVTARTSIKIWDPYEVLGVSRSADEKSIKRHYRKLSLTQHPDKVKIDASKNETVESVNEHWVEITKAFKALTDEEVRRNFLEYGHPDGKQSFSMGIALPKFLVEDGYGKYTLVFYLGLLGIFLPYVAGRWWYGTQRMTKDGILVNSAGNLVREFNEDMIEGDTVTVLSGGEEYAAILGADNLETGLSKVEKSITSKGPDGSIVSSMKSKDKTKLEELSDAGRRKVLSLIWAYLGRIDLKSEELNKEKLAVAPIAWQLNDAFQVILQAFGVTRPLLASYKTSQCLIQAVAPDGAPLLQLPFFTPEIVEEIESGRVRHHYTVQDYMDIDEQERRELTVGEGLLTPQQYQIAMTTAAQFPYMHLEKFWFKVEGEKVVTPNSLVQLVVKFRFLPPGGLDYPEVADADLLDPDGDRKEEVKTFAPPLAHAPYFARDHSPKWQIFLGQPKNARIAVPPSTFTTFDKPILTDDGEPTYNVQTMRMTFGAPPDVGEYTFSMHILNDSYLGFDLIEYITLNVEDPSKAEVIEDDGEISEPGEDSIAGQMKALRGSAPVVDSDESDTEGEAGDDTSDTNTDTDEE